MPFEEFEYKVRGLCATADDPDDFPIIPDFLTEDGIYKAFCGDVIITGNSSSNKVTVLWNGSHSAMACI